MLSIKRRGTCPSDSRVPPELVFDQKLGEVFAVRTAGETLSPEAIASIEYAIAKLGSHLIVVLGHANCGAVKAAIETFKGESAGSENLDKLVSDIHPRIKSGLNLDKISKDLKSESWANAKGAAQELVGHSKIISDAVKSCNAKIVVGLYELSSGAVEFEK
jgi:carbonic anhydrase